MVWKEKAFEKIVLEGGEIHQKLSTEYVGSCDNKMPYTKK